MLGREAADDYISLKKVLLRRYSVTEDRYKLRLRDCNPEVGETPDQFVAVFSLIIHKAS